MLRAGKLGAPLKIPVMGINFGHFGFLVETPKDAWASRIDDLLEGKWETDARMMIHAEHWSGEKRLRVWEVLNDIVLARALSIRPAGKVKWQCLSSKSFGIRLILNLYML